MALRRGVTLVEVLVVVGVIGLLLAIVTPTLSSAKDRAKQTGCLGKLQLVGKATMLYQADHDGHLPSRNPRYGLRVSSTGTNVPTYDPLRSYGLRAVDYQCPANPSTNSLNHPEVSDYLFRFVLDASELNGNYANWHRIEPLGNTVLAWDQHHGVDQDLMEAQSWIALRADGSVFKHPADHPDQVLLCRRRMDQHGAVERRLLSMGFPGRGMAARVHTCLLVLASLEATVSTTTCKPTDFTEHVSRRVGLQACR